MLMLSGRVAVVNELHVVVLEGQEGGVAAALRHGMI
jgi:hypothetical protein